MDSIMLIGGILYIFLFLFLFCIFLITIISFFIKEGKKTPFTPFVSIIIPAYNEEKNIKACIQSIHALDYPKARIEILVVDDGSRDSTASLAKKQGAKIIIGSHKGKTEALNLGIKKATHSFIFTIDADTVVHKDCLKELIRPFSSVDVGATTGNSTITNKSTLLGAFQNIEYHYNNLIRSSFSKVFKNGIWFFGAVACYRKSALTRIKGFKKDTLAEDMDIALELRSYGYRTVNVKDAFGSTIAPPTVSELFRQRRRWWIGTLQSLSKNRKLFSIKSPPSINFLFINQWWWSFYAFLSIPLMFYQVNYWLPSNIETASQTFWYLFRWFTLSGPLYVLYKVPEWGITWYSIFGVLSGIISTIMILCALRVFKEIPRFHHFLAIFLYFPYTILLNTLIVLSIIRHIFTRERFFIR
jgi:cellulose synthase/poly-beta-1,6-N-acetylglucosamine synthase-like glycosyltransferase